MKSSSKMLFMTTMTLSTLMVVSSSTWINMWMGMEINMMSFIPLISKSKNQMCSQASMSYFLIQSMSSMLFMMTILTNKYLMVNMNDNLFSMLIMTTMMMKMGVPPFHMWFPEIMNKISWMMCFILMTWQKIAPMFVMSITIKTSTTVMAVICLSALIGAIGGVNQTSTRKIMAYSSINQMSWMMACMATYKKSWIMFLGLYSIIVMMTSSMLHKYNIMYINQMNIFFKKNMEKIIIVILMLSMGGLPPFLGFIPKWIAIQQMITTGELMLLIIMVMSALITLGYYLRMASSVILSKSFSQKWMMNMKNHEIMSSAILSMNLMMPITILTLNMM